LASFGANGRPFVGAEDTFKFGVDQNEGVLAISADEMVSGAILNVHYLDLWVLVDLVHKPSRRSVPVVLVWSSAAACSLIFSAILSARQVPPALLSVWAVVRTMSLSTPESAPITGDLGGRLFFNNGMAALLSSAAKPIATSFSQHGEQHINLLVHLLFGRGDDPKVTLTSSLPACSAPCFTACKTGAESPLEIRGCRSPVQMRCLVKPAEAETSGETSSFFEKSVSPVKSYLSRIHWGSWVHWCDVFLLLLLLRRKLSV
jgi:hypothetical protein